MISYPCGKNEHITPSHLFKSVNQTYIILTSDTAYETKEKSCNFDTGIRQQLDIKGALGSADLKISKYALQSLNHRNFSNTEPIYTE